jgi:DNA-binding protein Fis
MGGIASEVMEVWMPRHTADETGGLLPIRPSAAVELSAIHATCVTNLVGHTLATIERELILQTLKCHQGNRTRAASVLRIFVRSLRDRIRIYRESGESVPEPGSPCSDYHLNLSPGSLIDPWQGSSA